MSRDEFVQLMEATGTLGTSLNLLGEFDQMQLAERHRNEFDNLRARFRDMHREMMARLSDGLDGFISSSHSNT